MTAACMWLCGPGRQKPVRPHVPHAQNPVRRGAKALLPKGYVPPASKARHVGALILTILTHS
eukprot:363869-Chlamydomonas_euryale.AAC.43